MEERRTAHRYKLALEIRLQPELKQFQPVSGLTWDISTRGFFFGTSQRLTVGMKMWFSIVLPPFEATNVLISGSARVVRVEELIDVEQQGIGVVIEGYKFGEASMLTNI